MTETTTEQPAFHRDDPQARNSHAPERDDRRFDQTQLKESTHGNMIHRDYLAHVFRWGFTAKWVKKGNRVLDVGCGQDLGLLKSLLKWGSYVPAEYVGVDYNRVTVDTGKGNRQFLSRDWVTVHGEFDFTSRYAELAEGHFDRVTCFEVIEHMYTADGLKLLQGLRHCLSDDGVAFLSTPVFNGKAARNHLHEYEIDELRQAIEAQGLVVAKRYGTFGNYQAIKKAATPEQLATLEGLREYYSDEVLACFLAPLYPDASRNNVWCLRRAA